MVLLVALLCIGWMPVMADAPTPWQMGFQDPATAAMEGIVDLHHDICFFLVTILVLVLWLGYRIVFGFHHLNLNVLIIILT